MRSLVVFGLLLSPGKVVAPHPAPALPSAPTVSITPSMPARASIRCEPGSHVELDPTMSSFGVKPYGERAFVTLTRVDGVASCIDDVTNAKRTTRTGDIQLRAITPRVVHDEHGARVVLTVEGSALGPFEPGDGIYLAWPFGLLLLDGDCPDRHADPGRLVVCAQKAQLIGRGPARVRVQSAGRLVEASTPLDLGALFGPT